MSRADQVIIWHIQDTNRTGVQFWHPIKGTQSHRDKTFRKATDLSIKRLVSVLTRAGWSIKVIARAHALGIFYTRPE